MIQKRIAEIVEDDLLALVGQAEDRQMEFKRDLPTDDPKSVKEFLKDVSAMANTIGGDLYYGIEEGVDENGNTVATQVLGIQGQDADAVKLRLNNLIRDCLKPSLIGGEISDIPLASGDRVYVVRVPRSWNSPHVVEYKGHWRFYYRSSVSSEMMDVSHLRHSMTFANTLSQSLQDFRLDRLAKIVADPSLDASAKIVLHFQPFDSLRDDHLVDPKKAIANYQNAILLRHERAEPTFTFNFDGLILYDQGSPRNGYIQIFRSGAVEEVDVSLLPRRQTQNDLKYIPSSDFEVSIVNAVTRRLGMLKDMEIQSPVILNLTLLGMKDYHMGIQFPSGFARDFGSTQERANRSSIDRDDLVLRGVLFEDFRGLDISPQNIGRLLQSTFDTIWNSTGFSRSLHYTHDGEWTRQVHL